MKQYTINLVPQDGPTLKRRTEEEYSLGYPFKVVGSDLLSMPYGTVITSDEIAVAELCYNIEFDVQFDVLSVLDYIKTLALDDHAYQQLLERLDNYRNIEEQEGI